MSFPQLTATLRAGAVTVEDLIERVQSGQLRIPRFQRPLRWRATNVKELFDSIWNNYPVGTLLFWQRPGPRESVQLGRLKLDLEARTDALYVVDGQQRIAALANVLLHAAPTLSSADLWALWFDLRTERLVTGGERAQHPAGPHLIPLNVVLDAVALQTWCTEQGLVADPVLFRKALALGKRIRQFVLPAYFVETDDELVLQHIFTRLNTAGQSMKKHEVFAALNHRADQPGALARARSAFVEAELGTEANEDFLLQCIRVGEGEDLSLQSSGAPGVATGQFLGPLSLALDFVRDQLHVPHHRLLPARWPLLVLIRLFRLHPKVGPRASELLRRWFWRGIVSRRSVDMNNARLHWLHTEVTNELGATLEALLADAGALTDAHVESFVAAALDPIDRTATAVEVRAALVLLAAQGPRHIDTGDLIDVPAVIEAGGSSVYGRAPHEAGEARWRLIHPRGPELVKALGGASPAVRESHLWVNDDPDGALRLAALRSVFTDTLRAWCGHGQSDHLPYDLLFGDLEGEE
jgi:hypothetical protein